jgi:hypothetical protein
LCSLGCEDSPLGVSTVQLDKTLTLQQLLACVPITPPSPTAPRADQQITDPDNLPANVLSLRPKNPAFQCAQFFPVGD